MDKIKHSNINMGPDANSFVQLLTKFSISIGNICEAKSQCLSMLSEEYRVHTTAPNLTHLTEDNQNPEFLYFKLCEVATKNGTST